MPTFCLIAYIAVRTRYAARAALDWLSWLPAGLPGILIGLGYLSLFLQAPIFRPLYGTVWVLILVVMLGSMTLGVQLLKSSLLQLGRDLEEASLACGASWWYTARHVVLPLIAPAMVVVGVLTFAAAARSTSHIALLATPTNKPLSLLQLEFMADGNFETASVMGVIILGLTLGVALIARLCGLRVDRAAHHGP
jgi:iron(III) transport system permease protein